MAAFLAANNIHNVTSSGHKNTRESRLDDIIYNYYIVRPTKQATHCKVALPCSDLLHCCCDFGSQRQDITIWTEELLKCWCSSWTRMQPTDHTHWKTSLKKTKHKKNETLIKSFKSLDFTYQLWPVGVRTLCKWCSQYNIFNHRIVVVSYSGAYSVV